MGKMMTIILLIVIVVLTQTDGVDTEPLEQEIRELRAELENINEIRGSLEEELDILKRRVEELEQELQRYEIFEFEATGYSPFDDRTGLNHDGNPNVTATGTTPRPGVIAVNPQVIPYGTRVFIQGYGWATAEDTGGAMRARNDLIDLYFDTHEQAWAWGRRTVLVLAERGVINREQATD